MTLTVVASALTIFGSLIGLWIWWIKRKADPTQQEQIQNVEADYAAIDQDIHDAEGSGNFARSDAILRRLRSQHEPDDQSQRNESTNG
jgi:hypothetical protein